MVGALVATAVAVTPPSSVGAAPGDTVCDDAGNCLTEGEGDGENLYHLREGVWAGHTAALGRLDGAADGATAVWNGGVHGDFVLIVDENGTTQGDWILGGSGRIDMSGSVNGFIQQYYEGDGTIAGANPTLTMSGSTGASGFAQIEGVTVSVPNAPRSSFSLEVELTDADCFELNGDWLFPLEQLAQEAGWSSSDIDGFFYATYVGDDPDDSLLDEVVRLVDDANTWGDVLVDQGVFAAAEGDALVQRSLALLQQLSAELENCLFGSNPVTGDVAEFFSNFLGTMVADMATALGDHEFSGRDLYGMSRLLLRLGGAGSGSPYQSSAGSADAGIQQQAQRIIGDNVAAAGDACGPCVTGDTNEVFGAALAGQLLGHEYEIEGTTFAASEVVEATVAAGLEL